MIRTVILDPLSNSIEGTFAPGDIVMVMCDATNEPFTVTMLDADTAMQITLKMVKSDLSSNDITLVGLRSQTLSGETSQILSIQGEMIIFNSALTIVSGVSVRNWW